MKLFDERRLAALRAYETIEMGRDHSLDALCNLVRLTFGGPMSAVSLVDDENTYHMGLAGMEVEVVPAQTNFCSHTIETDSPMLVEDASKDARFASNPFVTADPGIRSYMGAPLIASDGSALGAICAVDTKTRHFSNDESEKLSSLARTAMHILEMRRRVKEVRDYHKLAPEDFRGCSEAQACAGRRVAGMAQLAKVLLVEREGIDFPRQLFASAAAGVFDRLIDSSETGPSRSDQTGRFPLQKLDDDVPHIFVHRLNQ
ncbi:hypothetical protein GCM10007874_15730 [Labrys miyagiensis]|uniref:GAF domain-containing protein n=1 Tax=Labrys miyagiensis TaxID=346912 RepID=A0ABQ6CE62_9HYPH|nr:GAF domain-containing protein [Labrys miyagiensis]GLS18556.1 hypothetical protein GCM10007874_15730 [Labrys miyagiensis]